MDPSSRPKVPSFIPATTSFLGRSQVSGGLGGTRRHGSAGLEPKAVEENTCPRQLAQTEGLGEANLGSQRDEHPIEANGIGAGVM